MVGALIVCCLLVEGFAGFGWLLGVCWFLA